MSRAGLILAALWGLCLDASSAARAQEADQLYLGVRHERLFELLNVEDVFAAGRGRGGPVPRGPSATIIHKFSQPNDLGLSGLTLGVYPSVEAAREVYRHQHARYQVQPTLTAVSPPLGDEMASWKASVLFRRANVVVHLSATGPAAGPPLEVARVIDELLRDEREIAPRGQWTEPPEIVSVGAPERAAKGARVRLTPVFRGLGDPKDLRVAVIDARGDKRNATNLEGKSTRTVLERDARGLLTSRERTLEEDGRFELTMLREDHLRARAERLARLPDELSNLRPHLEAELAGPQKFTMIVATPENLIVTKEFTITLTDE